MGNFGRDDRGQSRSFGRRDFGRGGGGRSFGNRSFGRNENREMFKTTCSNCGNECEVPFRPTSGKPVYCSNCFEKMGNPRSESQRSDRPSFRQSSPSFDQNREKLEEISAKVDRVLKLLEPKTQEVLTSTTTEKVQEEEIQKPAKVKRTASKK